MDYFVIANSNVVFLLCAIVILFVLAQSIIFMRKAWKFGLSLNMSKTDMRKVMLNSATFSILPSIAILVILVILMSKLGSYFPWLRLSVVGSGFYENLAADTTAKAFGLSGISDDGFNIEIFVSAMWVMTLGIVWGPLYVSFGSKLIQRGVSVMKSKDEKIFKIIFTTMFLSLLLIFSAPYLSTPLRISTIGSGIKGTIPCLVMICAGISIYIIEKIASKTGSTTISEFSFPISLVTGMLSAVVLTNIL